MTDKQINAAIAEACGWKEVRVNGGAGVYKGFDNGAELRPDIPDYCNDLNAMHEAEKEILKIDYIYQWHLSETQCFKDWHATARQRAEALLKTLCKWEATTEESSAVQKEVQG